MTPPPPALRTLPATGAADDRVGVRAWIAVGILLLLTVLSSVDRTIIALMVDPIKADLRITDTQFSLLQGFAFVLFYALASLPMAWIADRTSRHWVIFFGVTFWSIATALCGAAQSFWQLFLARLGVGAGEAALSPSAYALIGEIFPARRMGMAVGMLAAGTAIGAAVAYGVGGAVVQWAQSLESAGGMRSWQIAFVAVGLPGILLAPMVFLIPGRKRGRMATAVAAEELADAGYLAWLRTNARYCGTMFAGIGFHAVLAYGTALWTPAYFSRTFGMTPVEIGGTLALVTGVAGIAGFVGGGWLTDRLHASAVPNAQLGYCLANCGAVGILGVVTFALVNSAPVVIGLLALMHMLFPLTGPAVAHLQLTTPGRFRARTIALMTVTFNLIGMTLGPTSAALFSDSLFGGPQHIGLGIAAMFATFAPIAALLFWLALKPARAAVERHALDEI